MPFVKGARLGEGAPLRALIAAGALFMLAACWPARAEAAISYTISGSGNSWRATPVGGGSGYSGSLKSVVENAANRASSSGGGTIYFGAQTYDLGSSWWELKNIQNVAFQGQGMNATIIQNSSSLSADTEPFNTGKIRYVTIRDMTVNAGGPTRTTSDALDFDSGNSIVIERVKVARSRGRGIVFDGKDIASGVAQNASNNVIRNCVISGVATHGIQFLAATDNRVEGCTITNTGGYGVQATKSSTVADQKNKKASRNVIIGNTIDNAGSDGINVNSSDANQILNNRVFNSANVTSGRDGIRITSSDSISCNDNRVAGNRAGDTQSAKTQRYGLHIYSSRCSRTVVGPGNDFTGNLSGPIKNSGSGTIFR
jgi:parallel beta-helix repeat protein